METNSQPIFGNLPGKINTPRQAFCHFHPSFQITNFDRISLMPLCPKCIPQHLQERQQQVDIESIDQVHLETKKILAKQINSIVEVLNKLNEFRDIKHDTHHQLQDSLHHAKLKVQRVLDAFFEQLERELHSVTEKDISSLDQDLKQAENFMITKLQELKIFDEKIHSDKYLKYMVRLHGSNFVAETDQHIDECHDFIEELQKKTLDIHVDDRKLYNLNMDLAKFVQIRNAEFYLREDEQGMKLKTLHNPYIEKGVLVSQGNVAKSKLLNPYADTSLNQYLKKLHVNANNDQNGFNPSQTNVNQFTFANQLNNQQVVINTNDYFESSAQNKFLHFFQEGTKNLYYYSVESIIIPSKPPYWRQVELNISFTIPQCHASVRTPNGQIYLIGGLVNNQLSGTAWRLDLSQRNLLQLNENMNTSRYGHQAVFLNNMIYVMAGAGRTDIVSMEAMDLSQDNTIVTKQTSRVWQTLPNMKHGGRNMTTCVFNQKFILKASPQGVEIYDTKLNMWQDVNVNVPLQWDCGLVQINSSSILVFGGSSQPSSFGLLKHQEGKLIYEPLQDNQNVGSRLAKTPIQQGTFVYQGRVYGIGLGQAMAKIIVGMSDQWII